MNYQETICEGQWPFIHARKSGRVRGRPTRAALVLAALLSALGIWVQPALATAAPAATVLGVSYRTPNPNLDVVLAIPKGIDNAARHGNADFGLRVTVSYVSVNDTIETLDSGLLSIMNDTRFLSIIDNHTVAVLVQVPLGATPIPGNNPSFSATAQLLNPAQGRWEDKDQRENQVADQAAAPAATVLGVSYRNGFQTVDLVVAIPKGIDNAARHGNADFSLRVTVTYVSVNDTIETLDSGLSIMNDTTFLLIIDHHTVAVLVQVPLGTTPAPGNNPSFSATAQLLNPAQGRCEDNKDER